jgi:hypothetical protein
MPIGGKRPYTMIGWLLIAAGWASLLGGWVGVQSTPVVAVQLAYFASGGLAGVALVTMGAGLQRGDDTRAIREILEELRERFDDLENAVADIPAKENRVANTRRPLQASQ